MASAPSLLEVQQVVRRAIADGVTIELDRFIEGDAIAAADRIAIHRHTAQHALVKTLALSHPVVQKLVGAEFFEGASRCYLEQAWPDTAWLDAFGAGFAPFLESFPPAATIPYLSDVARLEWAVHEALHAKDAAKLDLARLTTVPSEQSGSLRFVAHPSLRLLALGYAADEIWRAVIDDDDAAFSALNPVPTPRWLLVHRIESSGVQVRHLGEAEWNFAVALCIGTRLHNALEASAAGGVAQEETLGRLLATGSFVDFKLDDEERT